MVLEYIECTKHCFTYNNNEEIDEFSISDIFVDTDNIEYKSQLINSTLDYSEISIYQSSELSTYTKKRLTIFLLTYPNVSYSISKSKVLAKNNYDKNENINNIL